MDHTFINPTLKAAAQNMLAHLTGSKDSLKPLYLQPDRALFLAEGQRIVFKVYTAEATLRHEYASMQKAASIGVPTAEILAFEAGSPTVITMKQVSGQPLSSRYPGAAREAGRYLQLLHTLEAHPPFSGGQQQWDAFILWWKDKELEHVKRLKIFDPSQMHALQKQFDLLPSLLIQSPTVLLHGDLQTAHILIDPRTEQVLAFLDFADTQPGDPLLDIAVLTLWDQELTDFLLEGYTSIANTEETRLLLSLYRLLRRVSEIPWLLKRGFNALAAKNIAALKKSLPVAWR